MCGGGGGLKAKRKKSRLLTSRQMLSRADRNPFYRVIFFYRVSIFRLKKTSGPLHSEGFNVPSFTEFYLDSSSSKIA